MKEGKLRGGRTTEGRGGMVGRRRKGRRKKGRQAGRQGRPRKGGGEEGNSVDQVVKSPSKHEEQTTSLKTAAKRAHKTPDGSMDSTQTQPCS